MPENCFPIELESRVIECRSELERTMLNEAHNICSDGRISERHTAECLRAISKTCYEYGLDKLGGYVAAQVKSTAN
jgi:hypothetical protein